MELVRSTSHGLSPGRVWSTRAPAYVPKMDIGWVGTPTVAPGKVEDLGRGDQPGPEEGLRREQRDLVAGGWRSPTAASCCSPAIMDTAMGAAGSLEMRRSRLFGQLPGRNKLKAGSRLLVSPFPEIKFIPCCCGVL